MNPYWLFRDDLLGFAQWIRPGYEVSAHHQKIAAALEAAEKGQIKRLIISCPPQRGKPVYNETMVLMFDGSQKPIKDVVVGDFVIGDDGCPHRVSGIAEQGDLECVEITTKCGRSVIAALDHPFLTADGWVNAGDLEHWHTLACTPNPCTSATSRLTVDEAALLGYFVGDGSTTHGTTSVNARITCPDPEINADVLRRAGAVGFGATADKGKLAGYSFKGGVREWIRQHGLAGCTSHTKRVPSAVFAGGKDVVAAFVAAYFACDGTVSGKGLDRAGALRRDWAVEFYSIQKPLLQDIQHLLLRLGIQSRLSLKVGRYKGNRHESWRLTLKSQDELAKFMAAVPLIGSKARRLEALNVKRQEFQGRYLPDQVASVERVGKFPCRCITVEECHTYTVNDLVCHNTELTSIIFPAWALGRNPSRRFILSGYTAEVAERYSRGARDYANTNRYRAVFRHVLDPNVQNIAFWRFKDQPGYVRAVGVGGAATSFGADFFIIDDPIKDQAEAMSETIRQTIWDWYQSVVLTRLSPGATVAIIMTRWHADDLVGRLLVEQPGIWTVINIPAVSDEGVVWPERWTPEDYERIKEEVGPRVWQALYQGSPVADEGGLFKRSWMGKSPTAPPDLRWVRAWDLATSEKTSADFTVGALMAVDATKTVWVRDLVRGQWEWPEARRRIIQAANIDGPGVSVYVERGAFKAGQLCQDLIDSWERIDIPLYTRKPVGDKVQRALPVAARAESGRFRLVEGEWNRELIDEFVSFPFGKHDDVVDAVSLGWSVLASEPIGSLSDMLPPRPGTYAYARALRGEDPYEKEFDDQEDKDYDIRATLSGLSASF